MTTKQEKLAAARRKLKEFQGKNKESELLKQKTRDTSSPQLSKDYFYSNNNTPFINEYDNTQNNHTSTRPNSVTQHFTERPNEDGFLERKISNASSHGSNISKQWLDEKGDNSDESMKFYDWKSNSEVKMSGESTERNHDIENVYSVKSEAKQFFDNKTPNKSSLNDIIEPLQMELQNHAQTIRILVQQRNDAQTALAEAQQMLTDKSGETEELKQEIAHLNSSIHSLNQRLLDAERVIMKLKLEKEENIQKQEEMKSLNDKYQLELDKKEEECQEMKRKYEEENNNCQRLMYSLHEAQSQLSLCQIQLQQYSPEGHSNLAVQVSELQNENLGLRQKIAELEKKLEMEGAEKEESSQKFHIYVQQCNAQLSSLNSQLTSLKLENETLSQNNSILSKNLSELETLKENENKPPSESFETEIADLHSQLSALSEKNNQLDCDLKATKEACARLEKELEIKDSELSKLLTELKELEEENKNLANEAETPKANERLLATMESDKVAAAKAVSQNQKLKEQIVELEKAFIKLSEEKLELTNELAHEKHVNGELQSLLKPDHECHHDTPQPLLNDSNEIEELRNIVRQLQDDKMELTARLNSYESNRSSSDEETEKNQKRKCEHDDQQCEDTKLLLQKMEEKVRKTMNEIALLDEEKEKLEHLVLQLQGETETIGEYITLYQKQRMLLRQRAQEKDIQLMQLSKDKEELKSKLVALDELVQRLIAEKENISVQPGSKLPAVNTAGEIRALINEIGSTTLINNHSIAFEHFSCCSGRLITI